MVSYFKLLWYYVSYLIAIKEDNFVDKKKHKNSIIMPFIIEIIM